jgi:hypothetical protein
MIAKGNANVFLHHFEQFTKVMGCFLHGQPYRVSYLGLMTELLSWHDTARLR